MLGEKGEDGGKEVGQKDEVLDFPPGTSENDT